MIPLTSSPYISAYAPSKLFISGPPSKIRQLVNSDGFKDLRCQNLPIYAPFHASHLYTDADVADLVDDLLADNGDAVVNRRLFISGTGDLVQNRDFGTLLKIAARNILLQPLDWHNILQRLEGELQDQGLRSININTFGSKADTLIYSALKQTKSSNGIHPQPHQDQRSYPQDSMTTGRGKEKLAIIGMSGRFPDAEDNGAFWDILQQGLDVHKSVPALHWDASTHVDPTGTGKNKSATPNGCWLKNPAAFDARFFNISPREAPQIDPAQRLALMTAYEAIEQAGIIPDATASTRRDRVGVFYGATSMDWMETNSAQNIDTYFIPGGNRAFIPGRVNYHFKFSGPSFAVDTACSSSLAGIHLACNSVWMGDIDTAIAGGTNILTNPDMTAGLDKGHFLSRTGNCKTFDDSADGYCRGEGVGTVIIKRLDDAIADNDPILGVILGASTNHSAESESITRPHVGAQRDIYRRILKDSGIDPFDVSYVEMHGTGTQAGDAGEMSSVLDTFAPPPEKNAKTRSDSEALYLGSAKANIGHGESASGISSLVKVLLMMQKNIIVPHCGIKTKINHRFPIDLKERNVNIALEATPWKRNAKTMKPRRVFVNNFSAAGGNSALLIEDAPLKGNPHKAESDPRTHHVVAISAKTGVSLQGNLRSMLRYLQQEEDVHLSKLSYTTTARRVHYQHRVMLAASSVNDVRSQIEVALRDQSGMTRPKCPPKIVFTFTGQGAQYPGMMKDLYMHFSTFRHEICRLDQIAQKLGFPSVLPVIQSNEQDIDVFAPICVQLTNVCTQIALSRLWISWNVIPSALIGHSLGEYAALCISGVLTDADAIYLAAKRAELLQENCTRGTHAMLVVKASLDEIEQVVRHTKCEVACINSAVETVLAGPVTDIISSKKLLASAAIMSTILKAPYAFHSSQIEPILEDYKVIASGVTFSRPKIPMVCPLDGTIVDKAGTFSSEYLARHSREPVNMQDALLEAHEQKIITEQTAMIEIGPHPAVSGMVKAVFGPQVTSLVSAQRGRPAFQSLTTALKSLYMSGTDINWSEYHVDFRRFQEVLPLPSYSWDLKDYWIQYVNDWSLRKGDPPLMIEFGPRLESTTIHRILAETKEKSEVLFVVEADIARKDFSPLVQGHEVEGIPLCTPSVYAEMALSLGRYISERYLPKQRNEIVDVSDMVVSKALILRNRTSPQLLQVHVTVDLSKNSAALNYMSFDVSCTFHLCD